MKSWNELTRTQKILLGILIGIILISIPEAAFLLDAGGIELIVFFLTMYSQNIKLWFDMHLDIIKYPVVIETKTYVKSVSLTSVLFWVTNSFLFSLAFFLLFMFMRKG